ncbi:MAG: tetratricopeptide repeat protein [Pseudomonadota bacterium]
MPDYSNLSILIVDPNQGMRASLRNMLTQVGVAKVDDAVSSGTAIRQLGKKSYDLILCEYDLGNGSGDSGQDGQQLLEDLRHHKVIGQWTIFIMLTSEGIYSKVVSAAELLPSDYILKPFTIDVLSQRIARQLERRATFLPIYQMIGQGKVRDAIKACLASETAQPRYAIDYARLRAELLVMLGDLAAAEQVYQAIVLTRPVGWAQLGQARCLFQLKRYPEAQQHLETLIVQNPKFMAAYDLLAQTLQAQGQDNDAKKVLQDAVAISPHMVRRLRHLGEVAYATGDVEGAEKAFKQVVAKAKYSEFRDPEDHVNLVRTLVKKGDATGAGSVLRDLERSLRGSPNTEVCRAFSSALVQGLNGNEEAAVAELTVALKNLDESKGLSTGVKLGLAQSCMMNQMDDQAAGLLATLTSDPASGVTTEQVAALCVQSGREDMVERFDQRIDLEVDALVRQAADRSRKGDLRGAVEVLQQALRRRPDNTGLWSATATAMLRQLNDVGWDAQLVTECAALLRRMRDNNPEHSLLPSLVAQYAALRQKYSTGVSTGSVA